MVFPDIQDPGTKAYSEVNVDNLAKKVDSTQHSAVLKLPEGHDASKGEKPKISHEEIRMRVRGPKHIDIIVVELPGMINAGEGKKACVSSSGATLRRSRHSSYLRGQ
jgi:hypothetical protein